MITTIIDISIIISAVQHYCQYCVYCKIFGISKFSDWLVVL